LIYHRFILDFPQANSYFAVRNPKNKTDMKSTFGPQKLMFPCPTGLVVTGTMEKANIVTIAWISLLTTSPPTIGICRNPRLLGQRNQKER